MSKFFSSSTGEDSSGMEGKLRGRVPDREGDAKRSTFLSPDDFPSLGEFTLRPANLAAVDSVLGAACLIAGFEMAEIWTHVTDVKTGLLRPICLHLYALPQSIYGYSDIEKGHLSDGQRHSLSPTLVNEAKESTEPLWLTSSGPESHVHNDLPLNTAVAIPVSVSGVRHDVVLVFFSTSARARTEGNLMILTQLSMAASIACAKRFPAYGQESSSSNNEAAAAASDKEAIAIRETVESMVQLNMRNQKTAQELMVEPKLDMKWQDLSDVEFLVNGSRCTIYTAFIHNRIPVVVKVVRKDAPDKEVVKQELAFETDILQRLNHPNIVRLLGAGHKPEKFMVIERLDGGTLAQRCGNALAVRDRRRRFRQRRPFSYRHLLRCSKQMAEALDYMHFHAIPGHMVIHRDLKPDNVGFDAQGNLKLMDLGLTRVLKKDGHLDKVYNMTGETGSLRYMAPEVAQRKPYNQKADVYSFGMILWEMGSMRKPYEGMGREDFYAQVVHGGMLPPLDRRWPSDFVHLLHRCWRADPTERPNFDAIVETLDKMIGSFSEQAQRELPEQHVSKNKGLLGWLRKHSSSNSRVTSEGGAGTPRGAGTPK